MAPRREGRHVMHRWIMLAVASMHLLFTAPGRAADIILVSPGAVSSSLAELMPRFEQASGHKVGVKYAPALALADRIGNGEAADVAILGEPAADALQKTGRLVPGSKLVIATVGVGVFVRRGAAVPEVATVDASVPDQYVQRRIDELLDRRYEPEPSEGAVCKQQADQRRGRG